MASLSPVVFYGHSMTCEFFHKHDNSFFLDAFKPYDYGIVHRRMWINSSFRDKSLKLICVEKAFNIHSGKSIRYSSRQSTIISYILNNYRFLRVLFYPLVLQKTLFYIALKYPLIHISSSTGNKID